MSDIIIPSNPKDIETLKNGIREMTDSMTRIDSERDFQKDVIDRLHDETGIDKKYIRRMAKDHHKDNFDEKADELSDYNDLYETVFK